ncbi:MAG: hypothetical protein ACYCUM_03290 [Solirubrobacteraceae bacterium]
MRASTASEPGGTATAHTDRADSDGADTDRADGDGADSDAPPLRTEVS